MIKPYFSLGPIKLHYYGLIIAAAVYLGLIIAQKRAKINKIPEKLFNDPIVFLPLVLMLAGGRIYHVLDKWSVYSQNITSIFFVSNGGLGIWGALIGFFIGVLAISKIKKIKYLTLLDTIAPSVLLAQAIGRIGNYINQEGFGPPTNKPWGVYIDEVHRPIQFAFSSHFHPTFFYEAAIDIIFFIVLLILSAHFKKPGQIFGFYLICYSAGRFAVEYLRIDTWEVSGIKVAQVLSISAFAIGVYLVLKAQRKGVDKL